MPTSDLFVTVPIKPTMSDETLPTYGKLNNDVSTYDPRALKNMETFAGGPITDNAKLAIVKNDINAQLMDIMSKKTIVATTEPKPFELKEALEKEVSLADKTSKVCDSILGFDIGKQLDDLLDFEAWSDYFKDALKGFGIDMDTSLIAAMLSCGQALTKKGISLAKDAIPFLSETGNLPGVSTIIDKYGGSNISNLKDSVTTLAGTMKQTPTNIELFTKVVDMADPDTLDRFDLIGTHSNGYGMLDIEIMQDTLVDRSPIGDLMDVSYLSTDMKQVMHCDNLLYNGNSLMDGLYPSAQDRLEIEMANAARYF